ncbi:hypothetical protein MBOT_36360 [Mycobacterium botniense]|uniref:Uncharacterized protein n=1 Tax=Mycobacterium botniense TaxID=84962 RepID=A0A7I9Y2I4_9MYCO|nr:hypothetical protein MBOT_36360 [Mycobacterium botniense]
MAAKRRPAKGPPIAYDNLDCPAAVVGRAGLVVIAGSDALPAAPLVHKGSRCQTDGAHFAAIIRGAAALRPVNAVPGQCGSSNRLWLSGNWAPWLSADRVRGAELRPRWSPDPAPVPLVPTKWVFFLTLKHLRRQ